MDTYSSGTYLNGVVFLQPINQSRVCASEASRTRLFKKLLGEQAFHRVIIGGTMWNSRQDAERKIQQRKAHTDIWGDMVQRGATAIAYDNTRQGALSIIRMLMKHRPEALLIQKELATGKTLLETSAGRELERQKGEDMTKLKEELRDLKSDREATATEIRELRDRIYQKEEEIMELKRGC